MCSGLMDQGLAAKAAADDDAVLLARIAAGERAALAALFEREARRLIGVALRIVRRRELAEEVVQDSFVAVWQRARQFDAARGSLRGWLTTIVRNRALNLLRDGARVDLVGDEKLADLGDRQGDAMRAYALLPERDALRHCLDQLDGHKREAILLAYVVGMSHGEVANELGTPLGTVKAWIRRGTASLQECLS